MPLTSRSGRFSRWNLLAPRPDPVGVGAEETEDGDVRFVAPAADEIRRRVEGVVGKPRGFKRPQGFFSRGMLFWLGEDLVFARELSFRVLDLRDVGVLRPSTAAL